MEVTIERINEGILVTFNNGVTIWFESRHDAAMFGSKLSLVAAFGADTLDQAPNGSAS